MKQLCVVFSCFLSLFLVGCEDLMELEKQSYVIAVGVDLTEKEGLFNFTFQIANPESQAGSDTNGQLTDQTITIPTSDLITATDIANNFVTKKINLDHVRVMVVSEKLARENDLDRKSTRLNSSHVAISYAVFCLKKKINMQKR